jgi:Short C-terminal domain
MNRISGWSRTLARTLTLMLLLLTPAFSVAHAGGKTVIWETREGYVALTPQESAGKVPALPNNHPAEMTEELLFALLGSVQVRESLKEKPVPLFTEGSLHLLTPHLQQALRQAGPGEDVTFVIIGLYRTLLGGNTPKATSGRLFCQGGKLNLIFGVVKDEGRSRLDAVDRDYRLIAAGSRQDTSQGEWSLVPGDDRTFELQRRDWVVFDPKAEFAARPVPAYVQASPTPVMLMKKGAELPLTQRLGTLNELKEKGLITGDEFSSKRREIMNEKEPQQAPSDRLATLNELKKKGLITEEEYRAKRMQILGDL